MTLTTSLGRRLATLVIAAGLSLGLAANTAKAGHEDEYQRGGSDVCYVDGCNNVVCTHNAQKRFRFNKGIYDGQAAGASIGFQDGFYYEPFCDVPRLRFKHPGRVYARGYTRGFTLAYAENFRRGRLQASGHGRLNGRVYGRENGVYGRGNGVYGRGNRLRGRQVNVWRSPFRRIRIGW